MKITPYEKNAKKHDDKQLELLAKIVQEVGWRQNVEVNQQGVIVAGHGRYMAWEQYKDKYNLPEIWITDDTGKTIMGEHATTPLTEEQEKMWRMADNQVNAMTGFEMDLIVDELKGLSDEMVDLTGFDKDLIIEPEEKDDEVPDVPEEPKSKLGDLYELGQHRVLCGDSTKIKDVEKLMDGKKADMVFTDPPYGVAYQSNMRTKTDKFAVINNDEIFLDKWLDSLPLFSTGWVFIWTTWKVIEKWMDIVKPLGEMTNMVIWSKGGGGIGDLKKTFSTDYEIALVFNRGAELKGKRIGSVWKLSKDFAGGYKHPTQKPIELATEAITKTTDSNAIVMDLFLGSGSTLIASEKTDRICYGMELDPKYIDVIVQRYVDYVENPKVIRNGKDETKLWTKTQK